MQQRQPGGALKPQYLKCGSGTATVANHLWHAERKSMSPWPGMPGHPAQTAAAQSSSTDDTQKKRWFPIGLRQEAAVVIY